MNKPFSINELIDSLGETVRSTIELVAKNSPLDITTVETVVQSGLDKIRDRLASDFELVRKTEYKNNVELLEMLKRQVKEEVKSRYYTYERMGHLIRNQSIIIRPMLNWLRGFKSW